MCSSANSRAGGCDLPRIVIVVRASAVVRGTAQVGRGTAQLSGAPNHTRRLLSTQSISSDTCRGSPGRCPGGVTALLRCPRAANNPPPPAGSPATIHSNCSLRSIQRLQDLFTPVSAAMRAAGGAARLITPRGLPAHAPDRCQRGVTWPGLWAHASWMRRRYAFGGLPRPCVHPAMRPTPVVRPPASPSTCWAQPLLQCASGPRPRPRPTQTCAGVSIFTIAPGPEQQRGA